MALTSLAQDTFCCNKQLSELRYRQALRDSFVASGELVALKSHSKVASLAMEFLRKNQVLGIPRNGTTIFLSLNYNPATSVCIIPVLHEDTMADKELASLVCSLGPIFYLPSMHGIVVCENVCFGKVCAGLELIDEVYRVYFRQQLSGGSFGTAGDRDIAIEYSIHQIDCELLDSLGGKKYQAKLGKSVHKMKRLIARSERRPSVLFKENKFVRRAAHSFGAHLPASDKVYLQSIVWVHVCFNLFDQSFDKVTAVERKLTFLHVMYDEKSSRPDIGVL